MVAVVIAANQNLTAGPLANYPLPRIVLSDADIARYHRDGFLGPIDAFSPEEARGFRDRLEAFERSDGRQFGKGHSFKPHLLFPWIDAMVRHPAVLDPVEDIIGPDIRLFHFTIWPKSPVAHAAAVARFRAQNAEEVLRYEAAQ